VCNHFKKPTIGGGIIQLAIDNRKMSNIHFHNKKKNVKVANILSTPISSSSPPSSIATSSWPSFENHTLFQ
jgi:hypothetical protein